MSFKNILIDLREIFELFEDPKDKFIQLMDMAKESKVLDVSDKIDKNKIIGCTSQAWVLVTKNKDKTFTIKTDSDSQIVKGLLSILEKIFQDQTAEKILEMTSQEILASIGLEGSVSSQRTNGFSSAVKKIQGIVR
ncbi:MAG: SufE family protein [Candidatus Marinimicrobia bacterium]|jgi:cysteine desulfuration protein SufE|nr:SufE family protein [Candidatus Neomarinimicrobiota bacterium]